MRKLPVRVTIGRDVQLTVPGMLGRKFDFKPGHSFLTEEWFFPGEPGSPAARDEKGELAGEARDQWRFGTNTGTDLPLAFDARDVSEVVIANDPETIQVFKAAPFKVTIQGCQP